MAAVTGMTVAMVTVTPMANGHGCSHGYDRSHGHSYTYGYGYNMAAVTVTTVVGALGLLFCMRHPLPYDTH